MKLKYVSNPATNRIPKKEIKTVAKALLAIQKESSVITVQEIVRRAAPAKSPLHKYFEWDDSKAARRYREYQARQLIMQVYVVDADDENAFPVRAFVNLEPEPDGEDFIAGQGYVATSSVAGKQNYEAQVLNYAKEQLAQWKEKFGHYKEFFQVVRAIDSIT